MTPGYVCRFLSPLRGARPAQPAPAQGALRVWAMPCCRACLAAGQESAALGPANTGKNGGCHRWLPSAMGDLTFRRVISGHQRTPPTCAAGTAAISVSVTASSIFPNRHQPGIIQSWRLSGVWDRGSSRSRQLKRWTCTCTSLVTRPSSKMARPGYEFSVILERPKLREILFQAFPWPADFVQCYKCTSVGGGNELDFPFVNIQDPSEVSRCISQFK